MRLLVDSHALIWAVDDPSRLRPAATLALQDPGIELLVTASSSPRPSPTESGS